MVTTTYFAVANHRSICLDPPGHWIEIGRAQHVVIADLKLHSASSERCLSDESIPVHCLDNESSTRPKNAAKFCQDALVILVVEVPE
jgi:hypothetical protein